MNKFYKLRSFVDENKLKYEYLCSNTHPYAIYLIEKYLEQDSENVKYLCWFQLSSNPSAVYLLKKYFNLIDWRSFSLNPNREIRDILIENQDKIEWCLLCENSNFIDLIENELDKNEFININPNWLASNSNTLHLIKKYIDHIDDWFQISINPSCIEIIENNLDKVNFTSLSLNTNAVHLCIKNIDKIDLFWFSNNPTSIKYLEKNKDKINFNGLSGNIYGIHLLKNNKDKINWKVLSSNPEAIELLEENQDKIDYFEFSRNPSIFTYNYEEIRNHLMSTIFEELMKKFWHPSNFMKWSQFGFDDQEMEID